MSDFATTLKRIRTEKGMSQEEFATFLGTSKQNISRYEIGEVTPKISTAAKMAQKLGISLTELNGDTAEIAKEKMELQPDPEVQQELDRLVANYLRMTVENRDRLLDYSEVVLKSQAPFPDSED